MLIPESFSRHRQTALPTQERRQWQRVPADWRIQVFRPGHPLATPAALENISSGGIFFSTDVPLVPGEELVVHVSIPAHVLGYNGFPIPLRCSIEVMRVTRKSSGLFGVGARMGDYSVSWPHRNDHSAGE